VIRPTVRARWWPTACATRPVLAGDGPQTPRLESAIAAIDEARRGTTVSIPGGGAVIPHRAAWISCRVAEIAYTALRIHPEIDHRTDSSSPSQGRTLADALSASGGITIFPQHDCPVAEGDVTPPPARRYRNRVRDLIDGRWPHIRRLSAAESGPPPRSERSQVSRKILGSRVDGILTAVIQTRERAVGMRSAAMC